MHTLLILEASAIDRGVYDCVAKNAAGEAHCRSTVDFTQQQKVLSEAQATCISQMEVSAPIFEEKITSTAVFEQQDALFQCVVTGQPAPKLIWLRENNVIKDSAKYQVCWNLIRHDRTENLQFFFRSRQQTLLQS